MSQCVGLVQIKINMTFPQLRWRAVNMWKTRMHPSRMRTARSLTDPVVFELIILFLFIFF